MRVDIFTHTPAAGDHGSDWKLYVAGVLPSCSPYIVRALESQGERVRVFQGRNAGRMLHDSAGPEENEDGGPIVPRLGSLQESAPRNAPQGNLYVKP